MEKKLIVVSKAQVEDTDLSTTLFTCTYPGTVVGLRWRFDAIPHSAATTFEAMYWVIVRVQNGMSADTLGVGDAGSLYDPEREVMAWGTGLLSAYAASFQDHVTWEGATKTMRKMQAGDTLQLIVRAGVGTGDTIFLGAVQFFLRT